MNHSCSILRTRSMTVKCVVVGDTRVGKTKLVSSRAAGTRFTHTQLAQPIHTPSIWSVDNYNKDVNVLKLAKCHAYGINVMLRLWDTFGCHSLDRMFTYEGADVVLLCFAIDNPSTLKNAKEFWIKEIRMKCPTTPVILVGCKSDLRNVATKTWQISQNSSASMTPLYPCDGREAAQTIGAYYYEVSVLTQFGVQELFVNAIRCALLCRGIAKSRSMKHLEKLWNQGKLASFTQEPERPPRPASPIFPAPEQRKLDLQEFFCNDMFSDVAFNVSGSLLYAHRIVLSASSYVLDSVLNTDKAAINTDFHSTESMFLQPSIHSWDYNSSSNGGANAKESPFVVTVGPSYGVVAVKALLQFIYSGKITSATNDSKALVQLLAVASELQIPELMSLVVMTIRGQTTPDADILVERFFQRRAERLASIALDTSRYADFTIMLMDGMIQTHRVIMAAHCCYMRAMLCNKFVESSSLTVTFSDVSCDTFLTFLRVLFYGKPVPNLSYRLCIAIMQLVDRLCMADSMPAFEVQCIFELNRMKAEESITDIALEVLGQAQMFNADQVSKWCLHYLSITYENLTQEHIEHLKGVSQHNLDHIEKHRWPPLWYVQELANCRSVKGLNARSC